MSGGGCSGVCEVTVVHRLRRCIENKLRKPVDGGRGPPMGWKNRIFVVVEWLWSLFLHFPVAWIGTGVYLFAWRISDHWTMGLRY